MAHILGIGVATLDYIFEVDHFPREDEEMRAESLRICRGGNATNTLTILSQLGHQCSWGGVLAQSAQSELIRADLQNHGIAHSGGVTHPGMVPTSSILRSPNGSRTIVHYRDLPELSFEDFAQLDLSSYDWLHFEARNMVALEHMMRHARQQNPQLRISLEAEKARSGLTGVLALADVVLASRALALAWNHLAPSLFLQTLREQAPEALLFAAWGAEGAYALDTQQQCFHSPAFPPAKVMDTVGAGDTFNAGIIDALLRQQSASKALEHACRLAGRKCGHIGMHI